jgi:hypothetical protein
MDITQLLKKKKKDNLEIAGKWKEVEKSPPE